MIMIEMKNKQRGLNLIETLLVLGIIAILLLAAFLVYPQVVMKNKINKEVDNIQQAMVLIKNTYANRNTYQGFNSAAFKDNPHYPQDWKSSDGRLSLGGVVNISSSGGQAQAATGTQSKIRFQFLQMDKEACVPFSLAVAKLAQGDLYVSGPRGGTGVTGDDKRWDGKDPVELIARCEAATPKFVITFDTI